MAYEMLHTTPESEAADVQQMLGKVAHFQGYVRLKPLAGCAK